MPDGEAQEPGLRADHRLHAWLRRPPPCLCLADLPTPVEPAPWIDPSAEVWVKRDDHSSDLYGGGKVRKFEWLLASAPFAGEGPVLSVGGIGSNHLVSLALFLRRFGRPLHALTFEQVVTPHVRDNLATIASLGAGLWHVRTRTRLPLAYLAYHGWARPPRRGPMMAPGGSSGRGGLGFVLAGVELADQIEGGLVPAPATIYVTGGSAGSSAGLALGLALAGVKVHLRIVSAVERWAFGPFFYRRMLRQIFAEMVAHGLLDSLATGGAAGLLARAGVTWSIDHTQVGPGYAVPTPAGRDAVALAGAHGLHLDTTYTGKCLAALLADLAAGRVRAPVLFWNTHAGVDLRRWIRPGWEDALPHRLRVRLPALADG